MQPNQAYSTRTFVLVLTALLLGICLMLGVLAVLCRRSFLEAQSIIPTPLPAADDYPDTDIVYTASTGVGFVNADGSGMTTIPFRMPYDNLHSMWGSPMIAGNPETLIVTYALYPGSIGDILAAPAGGSVTECNWQGTARLAADGEHILVEGLEDQYKYLLADCGNGNPPEQTYGGVLGALSPDEKYSAQVHPGGSGADAFLGIILHDLETGAKRKIGEGAFPVWSRDGGWLAYTGADGIYIVQNASNAEPRRLAALEFPHPEFGTTAYSMARENLYFPPIVSWSPDGKWLLYHEYHLVPVAPEVGYAAQYYSIVRVNVETGETVKVLDGGYSPSWRWLAEEP